MFLCADGRDCSRGDAFEGSPHDQTPGGSKFHLHDRRHLVAQDSPFRRDVRGDPDAFFRQHPLETSHSQDEYGNTITIMEAPQAMRPIPPRTDSHFRQDAKAVGDFRRNAKVAEESPLVKKIFALFDADEDGVLSKEEYKAYLKGIKLWDTEHTKAAYSDKTWDDRWPDECHQMRCTTEGITKKTFEEILYGEFRMGRARTDLGLCENASLEVVQGTSPPLESSPRIESHFRRHANVVDVTQVENSSFENSGSQPLNQVTSRLLHLNVKEMVRQQMQAELEPVRMQLADLQKLMQSVDVMTASSRTDPELSDAMMEQKMKPDTSRYENMLAGQGFRLQSAENVLRELGGAFDKFVNRHDALMQHVQDIDFRMDEMDKVIKAAADEAGRMTKMVPASRENSRKAAASRENSQLLTRTIGRLPNESSQQFSSVQQASQQVEELSFQVDRRYGMPLGIVLRNDGSKLVVDQVLESCTIPFNLGDRIVAVDGVRANSKKLLEMVGQNCIFKITCQRSCTETI